ncbi:MULTISPECIES: hypothetical protein [Tsukamurella]|uniref:Uncharacterized protein n=2 Tax=Tsukamurella TaxID=2060 RepID=A0A5C5S663_9ACTN|nr:MULTISPECIES: hypothetical protein [Tsukamurella]NMD56899.1 hypothetical protein [Tsukamurella columbiensis]TWS29801.1 hypothetical protein FK530_04500 [Tsukamurella conjunctivitidis]
MAFASHKAARRIARLRQLNDLHTYPCPTGNGIHLGHQPEAVARGALSAADYARGAKPHLRRTVSAGVRARFAECFPPPVLASFGATLSASITCWRAEHAGGPSWRDALAPYADDPDHPVALLLAAPPDRKASTWRAQAAGLLMEALRDGQWITFDRRPGSLRSWR